jgi:tyrosyl-tRNA synthetase
MTHHKNSHEIDHLDKNSDPQGRVEGDFPNFQSDFLKILQERGFIHQITDPLRLDSLLNGEKGVKGYLGFDVTASSLHVGNLMTLMIARWFQKTGHSPVLLMGGGTTKIGDPSGRDLTRQLISEEKIQENIRSISPVFQKVFSTMPEMVNNDHWLSELKYIPFLREIGSCFSVNRMLSFDSVRLRLERQQNLSFIEFNYMLLQSYDFLKLYQEKGCRLQFGGSDQWGNIVSGVELIRRLERKEVFGLTCPLLTTASGAKMGKTAQGAVWLNEEMLSPYDYWQFWRSVEDLDVVRFLKLYTMLPLEEIEPFANLEGETLNQGKTLLADEATAFIHGRDVLKKIHGASHLVFKQQKSEKGEGGEGGCWEMDEDVLEQLPSLDVDMNEEPLVIDCLLKLGFISSKSQGRQLMRQRGVRLNQVIVEDEFHKIHDSAFNEKSVALVSVGRKTHGVLRKVRSDG